MSLLPCGAQLERMQLCLIKNETGDLKTPASSDPIHFPSPPDCCFFQNASVCNDFLAVTIVAAGPSEECFDVLYIPLSLFFEIRSLSTNRTHPQKKLD